MLFRSYNVTINQEYIPQLRISPVYQKMLKDPHLSTEEKEFIREKIKNGLLFIRGIEQRHHTVRQICQFIVKTQKNFLDDHSQMIKPMSLKDVAQEIGRNESTVCRAINNKYIETPQGLYPLKFFFCQGVSENAQGMVSNRSIKETLKKLIDEENKDRPLSDQAIQGLLAKEGMSVARRTISKYRQALNILPSNLRKN